MVDGQGVAVVEGTAGEVAVRDADGSGAEVGGDAAGAGVDGGDPSALAVDQAGLGVVASGEHEVPGREGERTVGAVAVHGRAAEVSRGGGSLPGGGVEGGDVGAVLGEDHDLVVDAVTAQGRVRPGVDGAGAGGVGGVVQGEPVVVGPGGDGAGGVAVAELVEGGAFPGVGLPPVGGQGDGVGPGGEGGEGAAGGELGELAVVPDQDQVPVGGLDQLKELVQGAGADHAGFVDDELHPRG